LLTSSNSSYAANELTKKTRKEAHVLESIDASQVAQAIATD